MERSSRVAREVLAGSSRSGNESWPTGILSETNLQAGCPEATGCRGGTGECRQAVFLYVRRLPRLLGLCVRAIIGVAIDGVVTRSCWRSTRLDTDLSERVEQSTSEGRRVRRWTFQHCVPGSAGTL